HLVSHISNRDALPQEVGREDDTPVFEPDLSVFESIAVGLRLFVLVTPGKVCSETCSEFLMIFEIAKAGAKFPGCRRPDERGGKGIKAIVELGRADAQSAQVVAEHDDVVQLVRDLAPAPHA